MALRMSRSVAVRLIPQRVVQAARAPAARPHRLSRAPQRQVHVAVVHVRAPRVRTHAVARRSRVPVVFPRPRRMCSQVPTSQGHKHQVPADKQGAPEENKMNAEFHRHSTRYRLTTKEDLKELELITEQPHYHPRSFSDKIAYKLVRVLRKLSDMYFKDRLLNRACMLETIAAVPGLVAGMSHHLRSLRRMRHCHWIKPTMDEAENERMHLMTFMELAQPSFSQKALVIAGQGVFMTAFFPLYMLFPRTCHRFVGYLEEEACHTYTEMLAMVDSGKLENVKAPQVAVDYWGLPADATLRDVILVVRADEADHRLVNHYMSDMSDVYGSKGLDKPCDVFDINLDNRMQTPAEREMPAGPYTDIYRK